ncbi:hypothetical protein NT6N_23150 [Oceaniferula spumae]|uniref:Multidrug resistance protein MdtA-like C-terminal permuted SH3 domain-containing protein n=1 Tax=Oceaniferula spumae TaxID=2979115 RepID=A0AAT9FMR9_9BACT
MIRTALSTLCLTSMLAGLSIADEYSVTEKPFKKVTTLSGVFLPTASTSVSINPEVWTDFTVTSLVPQGTMVKKGDTLIGIDTQKLDEYIAKMEKSRTIDRLNLAKAKQELAQLEITTPRGLENYARAEKENDENLKWYTEIGMPLSIESAKRSIKSAELNLAFQKEELKQLEKMYAEDNKTEETEEIILIRTRNSVERAEFSLKATKIDVAKTLETEIPRKLKTYQLAAESSRISNADAKVSLPRALELKRLEVAKAEIDDTDAEEKLAKLKADRAMMDIKAPADGLVYYGDMDDGRWTPASAVKVLKIGGKLPASLPLLTFIPANTPQTLSAFIQEANLSALKKGDKGQAITHLNRYKNHSVTIDSISGYPETDGTYHVSLTLDDAKSVSAVPGMKATVRVITGKEANAITVPADYLTRTDEGGYTVKLKLADGKTENREVSIGNSNSDTVVITKGLENGQVIVK